MTCEQIDKKEIMKKAIEFCKSTSSKGIGGPFGAAVVKDNKIICITSNTVLKDNDPTAHAEINAIREACKILGTYDLTGCELYATGAPCPMCLSAIIWANIKDVYYCNTVKDAEEIGFRDEPIYKYIKGEKSSVNLEIKRVELKEGKDLYVNYAKNNSTIY